MSTQQKENNWGYTSLNEVLSAVAPFAIGGILAIPALMYVAIKKKSLVDTVKNISYSVTSLFILNLTSASLIAYGAWLLSSIA